MDEMLIRIDERLNNILDLLSIHKTVLNINEVSQLIGLSKSTIYKLTCSGGIPHFKKSKHLYFDKVEIEAWLKSDKVKTKKEVEREALSYITKKGGVKNGI